MHISAPRLAATAGATLLAAAALTACTAGGSTSQQVTVHATDRLRFTPSTVTVHVGTVRVTLVDDGSYPHNLSVPGVHVTSTTVTGGPGERSTIVTLRFSHPGSYPFACAYHASAGMRGRFVVNP